MMDLPKGMRPELPEAPPADAAPLALAETVAVVAVTVQEALRKLPLPLEVTRVVAQDREVTLTVALRPPAPPGN